MTITSGNITLPANSISTSSISGYSGGGSTATAVGIANLNLPTTGFVAPVANQLGYTLNATWSNPTAYAMSGGTLNLSTMSLTPGVWFCTCIFKFTLSAASCQYRSYGVYFSTSNYTIDTDSTNGFLQYSTAVNSSGALIVNQPYYQIITNTAAGNTTYYCNYSVCYCNTPGTTTTITPSNKSIITATRIA